MESQNKFWEQNGLGTQGAVFQLRFVAHINNADSRIYVDQVQPA